MIRSLIAQKTLLTTPHLYQPNIRLLHHYVTVETLHGKEDSAVS